MSERICADGHRFDHHKRLTATREALTLASAAASTRETQTPEQAQARQTFKEGERRLARSTKPDRGATTSEQSPLSPSPGLADVERLAAATAGAGVRVDVRCSGEQRPVPADIDLSAYRIVQEALTNVVRHAGTGRCRVAIEYGDEELSVEVVDDGRGASEDGSVHGFGLIGMRERVGLLGGHLSVGPRPEGGFRVAARLPLPAPVGVPVEAR
ncbi:sensor histidine kinase [Streptomyces sp. NPDC002676]